MIKNKENILIKEPKNQLQLFGYKKYFNNFSELFKKKKLPNTILLSGPKGSGKATFAYHFINYLLSYNEDDKYSQNSFTINSNNVSYKNLCNYTHPNFHLVENNLNEQSIKKDSVKNVLSFLNKSSYKSNIKVVLIDNAEYLNISSSNAMLKSLEETKNNTFFFIIHNSSSKILDTIKSRCIEYKIFFNLEEKKEILANIIDHQDLNFNLDYVDDNLYQGGPGSILNYLMLINDINSKNSNNKLSCIYFLIDKYKKKKDPQILNFISLLVEIFYSELSLKNSQNLNFYFHNKFKILNLFNNVKKFNLDINNFFITLKGILSNER